MSSPRARAPHDRRAARCHPAARRARAQELRALGRRRVPARHLAVLDAAPPADGCLGEHRHLVHDRHRCIGGPCPADPGDPGRVPRPAARPDADALGLLRRGGGQMARHVLPGRHLPRQDRALHRRVGHPGVLGHPSCRFGLLVDRPQRLRVRRGPPRAAHHVQQGAQRHGARVPGVRGAAAAGGRCRCGDADQLGVGTGAPPGPLLPVQPDLPLGGDDDPGVRGGSRGRARRRVGRDAGARPDRCWSWRSSRSSATCWRSCRPPSSGAPHERRGDRGSRGWAAGSPALRCRRPHHGPAPRRPAAWAGVRAGAGGRDHRHRGRGQRLGPGGPARRRPRARAARERRDPRGAQRGRARGVRRAAVLPRRRRRRWPHRTRWRDSPPCSPIGRRWD